MDWVTRLHGKIVALDTAPLIYYIEEHQEFLDLLDPFFADLDQGQFQVVTSTVTLLEVLVHPLRKGDEALAHQYNSILLSSRNVATLPVTFSIAQHAAELRAQHDLKSPDAIQLAVARVENASAMLTNDRDFPSLDGLEILRLKDLKS